MGLWPGVHSPNPGTTTPAINLSRMRCYAPRTTTSASTAVL